MLLRHIVRDLRGTLANPLPLIRIPSFVMVKYDLPE